MLPIAALIPRFIPEAASPLLKLCYINPANHLAVRIVDQCLQTRRKLRRITLSPRRVNQTNI